VDGVFMDGLLHQVGALFARPSKGQDGAKDKAAYVAMPGYLTWGSRRRRDRSEDQLHGQPGGQDEPGWNMGHVTE
jgi:hypothetical protein